MRTNSIISFYPCGKCFIPCDGKLNESEIKKVIIDIVSEKVKYEVNIGQEVNVVRLDMDVFANERDYKNNQPVQTVDWSANDIARKINRNCEVVNELDCATFYGWVFEAPIPVRKRLSPDTVIVEERKVTVTGANMPEHIYASYRDALDYNEAIVRMEDGSEKLVRGPKLRLALTDSQKSLIEDLRSKLRECQDAGVRFIYNSDDWIFGAFNSLECEDYSSLYRGDGEDEGYDYYVECGDEPESLGEIFPTSLNVNCDTNIFIKFKK